MAAEQLLSVRSIALRSLLVGAGLVLLLVLVSGPDNVNGFQGPAILALWIAAIFGSTTMAWTRAGLRRWAWAALATLLLFVLTILMVLPVRFEEARLERGVGAGSLAHPTGL